MGQLASDAGRKLLALGILLVVAFLLFKLVAGFVMTLVWAAVAVVAVVAVFWAVRTL